MPLSACKSVFECDAETGRCWRASSRPPCLRVAAAIRPTGKISPPRLRWRGAEEVRGQKNRLRVKNADACLDATSLRGAPATKQSSFIIRRAMDCFASLAMTISKSFALWLFENRIDLAHVVPDKRAPGGALAPSGASAEGPITTSVDCRATLGPRSRPQPKSVVMGRDDELTCYPSSTASAPFTASAPSVTVFSSAAACTEKFSAKNRARAT